jgi:hypothetical protein
MKTPVPLWPGTVDRAQAELMLTCARALPAAAQTRAAIRMRLIVRFIFVVAFAEPGF